MPQSTTKKLLPTLLLITLATCTTPPQNQSDIRSLTILYTNDEHGWMQGMEPGQGAANLMQLWKDQEGYHPDGPFLLLSGGDNWTGPAISTWTRGESMVEVMNAMAYDASAVGNHEFDFGLEVLAQRTAEADFPYLSANTRWRGSQQVPVDLGILPYTVTAVNGISVGIIGLTTRDTPTSTNPANVTGLDFIDYELALRETVPHLRERDIDLLLVVSHVCIDELLPLIETTADLGLDMVGAGHCNELEARLVNDTVLLGGGYHFTAYARADFSVDIATGQRTASNYTTQGNTGSQTDPQIAALIRLWSSDIEASLSEVIAHSDQEVARGANSPLNQAIIDSWLWHDDSADIAITNAGGIRIDLPAGEIDLATLVAMMPFDNTIVAVTIPGATVINVLENGSRPVVAGVQYSNGQWLLTKSGQVIDPQSNYRVLVNSFMYAGGDGYESLKTADPSGFDTAIHYRQPFVEWLRSLQTSPNQPLSLQH